MYKDELKQMQAVFDATVVDNEPKKATKGAYEPAFPVGEKSEAVITNARVSGPPWPNDDRIFLSIELTHPISDRSETMWLPLVNLTDASAKWVKSQLKNVGYDTDETPLSDIEDHMDDWIGYTVEIFTKRNARGKIQFYINKIISDGGTVSNFDPDSTDNGDDDIPF
jgi:hypothetical protein